ncbi:protein turtle homolog A [Bacillus rossius redtenbacheri]|uniref:protein turtle homolog A n=1 Tax=Bacillus rossius redtenbacheri TaxID=93214 RepID=UPI002FDC9CEC
MVIKKLADILLLFVIAEGCCYATRHPELLEVAVDVGENLTLPCADPDDPGASPPPAARVMWERVHEGRVSEPPGRLRPQPDGGLFLPQLERGDAGVYLCSLEQDGDGVRSRVNVRVRTPPPALQNVTVHPSTVLALLLWDVAGDGGYPISHFSAHYRQLHPDPESLDDRHWHSVKPEHISPNVRQIDVYRLDPNTTYVFKVWANNQLGPGEATQLQATTLHSVEEIELARQLLDGVDQFDTRVWVVAVAVVMGTLLLLAAATSFLLYRECRGPLARRDEQEAIELVPNIILNPGYYDEDMRVERVALDENSNDHMTTMMNNNTVVQPIRV